MIIENKIWNRMISAKLFTFSNGNKNIKIRGSYWWLNRTIYQRGVDRNWFRGRNFWTMSVDKLKILNGLPYWHWCMWFWSISRWHWWRISRSRCRQRHRQWKKNRRRCSTRNQRREIWNKLKERDIGKYEILFGREIVTSVSFLSLKISNKNTFDRSRRQFV